MIVTKSKNNGTLFLIPSSLDQEVVSNFLIEEQKKIFKKNFSLYC